MIGNVLVDLQRSLEEMYDLASGPSVVDFLVSRERASSLAPDVTLRGEALVIREAEEEVSLALFLEAWVLEADRTNVGARLHAIEGVSHFVYVAFKGALDVPMTCLEMEIQAEVDKYLLCATESDEWVGLLSRHLERPVFRDPVGSEARERYEVANREARRFCRALEAVRSRSRTVVPLLPELRRFYRMGQQAKIEHIRRRAA